MQKRKLFGLLFISLLVLTVSLSFVSATGHGFADQASDFVRDILDFVTTGVLEPVFEFLLGEMVFGGFEWLFYGHIPYLQRNIEKIPY